MRKHHIPCELRNLMRDLDAMRFAYRLSYSKGGYPYIHFHSPLSGNWSSVMYYESKKHPETGEKSVPHFKTFETIPGQADQKINRFATADEVVRRFGIEAREPEPADPAFR